MFARRADTQEDILGLHVAVNDALGVGRAKARQHRKYDPHQLNQLELAFAFERDVEGLTVKEVHHQRGATIRKLDYIVNIDDVRMTNSGCNTSFLNKAAALFFTHPLEDLEGDRLASKDVVRCPDRAHPTLAQELVEGEATLDGRSRLKVPPSVHSLTIPSTIARSSAGWLASAVEALVTAKPRTVSAVLKGTSIWTRPPEARGIPVSFNQRSCDTGPT